MQIIISGSFRPYYAKRTCLNVKAEDRPTASRHIVVEFGHRALLPFARQSMPFGSYSMPHDPVTRRDFVLGLGAGGLFASTATPVAAQEAGTPQTNARAQSGNETKDQIESRARRLAWWREAKFGMFIHWG